jgi:hypothetical protein
MVDDVNNSNATRDQFSSPTVDNSFLLDSRELTNAEKIKNQDELQEFLEDQVRTFNDLIITK